MAARRTRSVARRRSPVLLILSALVLGVVGGYLCYYYTQEAILPPEGRPLKPRAGTQVFRLFYSVAIDDGEYLGSPKLYSVKSDGSGQHAFSHPGGGTFCSFESVSYDGELVAYTDGVETFTELFVSTVAGKKKVKVDGKSCGILGSAAFSPDGKSLVYCKSDEHNGERSTDLYLATLDGLKIRQLTDTDDDDETPLFFSQDSTSVYYTRNHLHKYTDDVTLELDLATGKSQRVVAYTIPKPPGPLTQYEVTTKETGKKVVMGIEGTEEEVDETVDTLNLIFPGNSERVPIAHGAQITVLGWARE